MSISESGGENAQEDFQQAPELEDHDQEQQEPEIIYNVPDEENQPCESFDHLLLDNVPADNHDNEHQNVPDDDRGPSGGDRQLDNGSPADEESSSDNPTDCDLSETEGFTVTDQDGILHYDAEYGVLLTEQQAAELGEVLNEHQGEISDDKLLEDMLNLRLANNGQRELELPAFPPLSAVTTSPSIYPHLYNLPSIPSYHSLLPPLQTSHHIPVNPLSSTTTTLSLAGGMASVVATIQHNTTPVSSIHYTGLSSGVQYTSTAVQYTSSVGVQHHQDFNTQVQYTTSGTGLAEYNTAGLHHLANDIRIEGGIDSNSELLLDPPYEDLINLHQQIQNMNDLANGTSVLTNGSGVHTNGLASTYSSSNSTYSGDNSSSTSIAGDQQFIKGGTPSSSCDQSETSSITSARSSSVHGVAGHQVKSEGIKNSQSESALKTGSAHHGEKSKPSVKPCNHKHNNANAKELKQMMKEKNSSVNQFKKSKSASNIPVNKDICDMTTDEEGSSPEDSCSSSVSGTADKNCACCYCEVFGHSGPAAAPVSRNYPEMRERLRTLLNKKKRSNKNGLNAAQASKNQAAAAAAQTDNCSQAVSAAARQPQQPAAAAVNNAKVVAQNPTAQQPVQISNVQRKAPVVGTITQISPATSQQYQQPCMTVLKNNGATQQPVEVQKPADSIAKKDVDEILDFIEGKTTATTANEKKKLKKERQKQQKLEELRIKQEEERQRKFAEEAARKKRQEDERLAREAAEKAAKKSKKKAAQKAKKLVAQGITPPEENSSNEMDLEALHFKHIQEQKELLEKQKQELIKQQQMLDLQLKSFPSKIGTSSFSLAAGASISLATPNTASSLAPSTATSAPSGKNAKKNAKKSAKAAANIPQGPRPGERVAQQNQVTITSQGYYNPQAQFPSANSAFYQPQYNGANSVTVQPMFPGGYGQGGMPYSGGYPPQPNSHLMQPHFSNYPAAASGLMPGPAIPSYGGPSSLMGRGGSTYPAAAAEPPKPAAAAASANTPKSDQPMVTIKRVMRPDTNEPTVTISVKKEEANQPGGGAHEREKVLFTLINGQVMKTGHAPDNLIPSAKPLSKELARQFLPDDLQEATLTKKQRKKQKKKGGETAVGDISGMAPVSAESLLSSNLQRLNLAGSQGPAGSFNFKSGQLPRQSLPGGGGTSSAGNGVNNRVPLTDDGRVDLQRLSLPQGISISKITGPVPERKYFPSKPAPEGDLNSKLWPHQQPGYVAPPPAAESGVDPMYANDPNVIVVDTNSLPTRAEEEQEKSKQRNNKHKQKSTSPEFVASKPTAAAPGGLPLGGVEYTPGKPLPPAMAAGGSGQVLIKSVNGKVVITPVPDPIPPPMAAAANQPPPAAAAAKTTVMNGSGDMTAVANGIKSKVIVNGAGNEGVTTTDGAGVETTKKKKGKKKKNTDENLHDINSVFAPRDGLDLSGDMDAADREIEQFKQFCLNTVMLQNRTKVNLDLKSIKKKE